MAFRKPSDLPRRRSAAKRSEKNPFAALFEPGVTVENLDGSSTFTSAATGEVTQHGKRNPKLESRRAAQIRRHVQAVAKRIGGFD
jgi:hypothetical protein